MFEKRFAIINDFDRPEPKMVCELVNDRFYYCQREIESRFKHFDGMQCRQATFLEDFGFDFVDQGTGVEFVKVRESVAKYPDGVHRDWQGALRFFRPKVRIPKSRIGGKHCEV